MNRRARFPLGARVTREQLDTDLYGVLGELSQNEPVSWLPSLNGWMVTRRDLVLDVLRDPDTFTVDDPRFSTAQVLGPSMLSLDGPEHSRHRSPFAAAFRKSEVGRAHDVRSPAESLVQHLASRGKAELRRDLAGPLAVAVVTDALGLVDVDAPTLLAWYEEIVDAVVNASDGTVHEEISLDAVRRLGENVRQTASVDTSLVATAKRTLAIDEVVSNVAVALFGGIETSEGMTATAFAHLLTHGEQMQAAVADRSLLVNAIEESLRLEPAVVQLDRYTTSDTRLAEVDLDAGDFVMLSVAAANRDPLIYTEPDRFDISRANAESNLTFARGTHSCIGRHLARAETLAALHAALDHLPGLRLTSPVSVTGSVFRKPVAVHVEWDVAARDWPL